MSTDSIEKNKESISKHWFRIKLDKEEMQSLAVRSDYEGWKHVTIFFTSLFVLASICILT